MENEELGNLMTLYVVECKGVKYVWVGGWMKCVGPTFTLQETLHPPPTTTPLQDTLALDMDIIIYTSPPHFRLFIWQRNNFEILSRLAHNILYIIRW